jgi:hypothetical protein
LAVDFGFEGLPENLPTGYTVVDFHNHGVENHEIIVARKNDGVTETAEELLALPEEEAMEKVTMIGFGFAQSEGAATISWNLDEPGDYFALCFLPVGSVGEAQGEGPPHFTQGMLQEFTVS